MVEKLSALNPKSILIKGSRSVRLERLVPLLDAHTSISHTRE